MKKIGDSFKGILGGIVAIIIGIGILWWNEGNNVKNLKTTAEMEKSYIDVSSEKIDQANEGKLIATQGKLINEKELLDEKFDVKVKTPLLKRVVEMYQWEEESNTEDDVTTYTYKKVWSSSLIDSSSFHESNHNNPTTKPYSDAEFKSDDVRVGAFSLSSEQISDLSTNGEFNTYNSEKITELGYAVNGIYITNSKELNDPQIGDVRISFVYNNSDEISVLAVQKGNSFVDFVSKAGKTVNRIMDGSHSGIEMINIIKKENKILKWALRLVGTLIIVMGIATILKPISTITSFIPLLGSIVSGAVGLVSFILGLALSLLIIAVAWIRFRPILGISLIAIVIALITFLIIRSKKTKPDTNEKPVENNQNEN